MEIVDRILRGKAATAELRHPEDQLLLNVGEIFIEICRGNMFSSCSVRGIVSV